MKLTPEENFEYTMTNISLDIDIIRTLAKNILYEFEENYNSYNSDLGNLLILLNRLTKIVKQKFHACNNSYYKLKL